MAWLFLVFVVVPVVELMLLTVLGNWLGLGPTLLLVLVTGVVGGWLAKREGFGVLSELRNELAHGLPPGDRLMEGGMVLVGGLLLVTPGVLTDLVGFALIFPVTRRVLAPRLLGWLSSQVDVQVNGRAWPPIPPAGPPPTDRGSSGVSRDPQVRYRDPLRPQSRSGAPSPFANKFDDLP